MKILVTGGRKYANAPAVDRALDHYLKEHPELTIIQGGATGADYLAKEWAKRHHDSGVKLIEEKADWSDLSHRDALIRTRSDGTKYDAKAGMRRNRKMLREHKPNLVIAFPGGRGTADCVKQAKKAQKEGVEIAIIEVAA